MGVLLGTPLLVTEYRITLNSFRTVKQVSTKSTFGPGRWCMYRYYSEETAYAVFVWEIFLINYRNLLKIVATVCFPLLILEYIT
jgi:hypothetical protein